MPRTVARARCGIRAAAQSGRAAKLLASMPQVQLIIDLVTPGVGRRRVERSATLPGVPAVGEYIDTIPGPTLALHVTAVRWHAIEGTASLFLGAGRSTAPGMTHHDGELELADYLIEALRKAGWDIGEYE